MSKCAREGCNNAAVKTPVLYFASEVNPSGAKVQMRMRVGVCDEHAGTDPDLWISDEGRNQIVETFAKAKKAKPDRDTIVVTYEPLQ